MKVLIYSGSNWNGIWSHSHELAKHFAKHAKVVFLSVPACQDPGHPNISKKTEYPVPKNTTVVFSDKVFQKYTLLYLIYTQFYTITKFFSMKKPEHFFLYNTYDIPFFILAKLFGKKVHFMYIDDYPALAKHPLLKAISTIGTWLFLKFSEDVFCTARVLEQKAKEHNKNVYYVPNSVNLEDAKNLRPKTRKEFIIGFVGTIGHWVRTDQILDIARAIKNAKIWIVGSGEGLETLQKHKKQEKLNNLKLFGFVSHEKMYKLMSQFDVAIIPFHINEITNAVSPIKLFEYWLAKKPVVCTKTTELAQFKDEVLYANRSEDFIKQLTMLKNSTALRKKLAGKGHKRVIEKYNWNKMIEVYRKAL